MAETSQMNNMSSAGEVRPLSEDESMKLVEQELSNMKTLESGLKRLNRMANSGSTKAMLKFAKLFEENKIYKQDYKRVRECLIEADKLEDPEAAFQLGRLYRLGLGVDPDPKKAELYFKKAAKNGNKKALYQCAVLALDGGRTVEGVMYLKQSINAGYGPARYDLAVCLLRGEGVRRDEEQAVRILRNLAKEGDIDAKEKLRYLFAKPQFNE